LWKQKRKKIPSAFTETTKAEGLITWQISARAEISAWLAGLKFQPCFWNKFSSNQIGDYTEKDPARISAQTKKQKLRSRSDFSGIKAIKWRISLISKLRWNMRTLRKG